MRPPADYVALRDLLAPGSDYAYAARRGDEVTEAARHNSGWIVGTDVRAMRTDSMPRPDDADDRRAWQDYAVVRGVPYSEATRLDRDDLIAKVDGLGEVPEEPEVTVPEEKAGKAAWVDYAVAELTMFYPQADPVQVRSRVGEKTKPELVKIFGADADDPQAADARRELAGLPEQVEVGPGGLVRPVTTDQPG